MKRRRSNQRKRLRVVVVVVTILVILFLILERAVVPVANRLLDRSFPDHDVSVVDVDLKPWRGAYAVEGFVVRDRGASADSQPLLEVERVDLAVDGRAFLQGAFVGSVQMDRPVARYTVRQGKVHGVDADVAARLRDLHPLRLNRVVVNDGVVAFTTEVTLPSKATRTLDLNATDLHVQASNLTNSARVSDDLFGTIAATASIEGWGDVDVDVRLKPTAEQPTFDLDASVRGLPLPTLNDWSRAFGRFTFSSGTLDLFTETAAQDGRFRGYVKPLAKNAETAPMNQDLGSKIIAGLAEGALGLLENQETRRAGSRIELEGRVGGDDVNVDVVSAIVTALRNALVEALRPIVDGDISLTSPA